MLTKIELEHFKCFEVLRLPLADLTLLTGTNASGKSSALQALVLLRQTMNANEWSTKLQLNGSELSLGTVTDVVDKVHGRRAFSVGVAGAVEVTWQFSARDRRAMSVHAARVVVDGREFRSPERLHYLVPDVGGPGPSDLTTSIRTLTYLTAERVGPREVYPLEDPDVVPVVGPKGENAASLLYWAQDRHVDESLRLPSALPSLLHQVNARMSDFFPGCALTVQPVPQSNGVTLGLRTSTETDYHRPVHVGFGLTQVLPIVVATLSSRPGSILLIENPEVHLHPAGQAKMGAFLAQVANAGVQVLVETHSDHVLNGVRRAVRASTIGAERVQVHFFTNRNSDGEQVLSPSIDAAGNVDFWPDGFFDQFDKDMNHLAGWGD